MEPTTVTRQAAAAANLATTDAPARPRLETPESAFARSGTPRSTAYELMDQGTFPKPVKLGRANRFVSDEIDAWILARIAARDAALNAGGRK